MIGAALGPYTVLSELGTGGMGTVYLAEAPEGRRRVAVKVVHPHLIATPGFFKRFMREAELGRKVKHENVVRTLDVDATIVDGQQVNYMVMEYVEGKSLRDLLLELRTVPEALLREIARQAAAGLTAIHAADVVHRDLKPENILITDDQVVRIMDLGVAKLQEASIAITKEGQFAGSVLYAAPEQFSDKDVGPAADLYSLGVLLLELATGSNPFRRDDAAAVIQAHLQLEPERAPDLSPFLAEVVATLLAKEPAGRFASAEELGAVLDEAERSEWWAEREKQLRARIGHLPRIAVRRETMLHARDEQLALLRELFELATAGQGGTILLEGEAGIGKTRLVDEFVRSLEGEDVHVLYGNYPPSGGLGGLSDAILGKFGQSGLVASLRPYLKETPSLVPAFAALVKHEAPPTGSDPLQGDALHAVACHLMRSLAAEKPTLWILEDLHFAPADSRHLLLSLARAAGPHAVLVVASARPGLPDDEVAHFGRLENFKRVPLTRLGAADVIHLLGDAFKSEALAEKLGGKIAVKSDGVPFFVFEMIRGLKEGQFITEQPDGTYVQTQMVSDIEVPSAVKDLIEGRMRGLTENQRAILDAGAVQGVTFDPDVVADVVEERPIRVLRELAEIERRHGLVRGDGEMVRFDQNQIQEVLYGELLPKLRREYHSMTAEAHEGDDAYFLAYHHLRGSRPKKGLPHLDAALGKLEKAERNEAVLDLADRALEVDGLLAGEKRVEVLLRKNARLDQLGRRDEQRALLDEAVALADETGDAVLRGKARRSLGGLFYDLGQLDDAREAFEAALELARAAGDRELEATTTNSLGNVFLSIARHAEAEEHYERSCALSREIGYRRGEAMTTGNLGIVFKNLGRYAEAQAQQERARALYEELGDRRGVSIAMGNLGLVFLERGQLDEARKLIEHQRALNRELGYRKGESIATGNLGNVFSDLGRFQEAREHHERHRALSREIGYREGESIATGNLGNVYSDLGRYAEAKEHHERHRAISREIEYREGEAIATGNLGGALFNLGRRGESRECAERYLALSREIGYRSGEGYALTDLGHAAEAGGNVDDASRLYEEALALRRELGERGSMADTLVMLGRVQANAPYLDEALELARETRMPETILEATVERARLPGGDVPTALAALEEHEERVGHSVRMAARFRLWQLTDDRAHLEEAKRLLDYAVEHAPDDCRESMINNVPLHKEIRDAR